MGKVSHDIHGAWDETLHPRDAHGQFIKKGGNVRLPDGSIGKVVASRDSTIGAVITVRRKDGSTLHIPAAQTATTKQKATADPLDGAGARAADSLINHTPERGSVATAANTTPGHRVAVAGGRTGTITAVRPASGTATYVEDGTQAHRTGLLNRITHLGASQPDRGTPANLRNTQPGHHVAIVGKDDGGNKTITTGTVVGVHANPGTNTPTATVARDGSGNIVQAPLDHMSHLPTIAQLAHGNPPPRINTPIVADDARAKMVEQAMDKAVAEGKATDKQFKDPKTGVWSADRRAIHQQIVDEVYAKFANVPSDRKAIIAGGLPGAGKTTILKKNTDLTQYVNLNPDEMKEELIKRGLAPQVPGLTPMESVMLIHEESSDLTKMLAARAYRDHKNVMWDITMQSPGSVRDKLTDLKANGYTTKGVFVSTTLDRSLANVRNRWQHGIADYNNGKGFGGRYVPEHISRSAASDNALFRSKNEDTFSQMRRSMDDWELWDNSQNQQRLVTNKAHTTETGGSETAPLSIDHPQPGADTFLPEPTLIDKTKPEPDSSVDRNGAPLNVGDPVDFTEDDGTTGTGTIAEINNNWGGGPAPHAIVINRSTGGQAVVENTSVTAAVPMTPGLPGTRRAELLAGIPLVPDVSGPAPDPLAVVQQKSIARSRLTRMATVLGQNGYTADSDRLRAIANSNDLTVSSDGSVVGGSEVRGNGQSGPFMVVGSGNGTPLRPPRGVEDPADKQSLVNDIAAASPYLGHPAVANRWQGTENADRRRTEAQAVTDAWHANAPSAPAPAPATDGPSYGNGTPVRIGDRVSYGNPDNPRTGTVSDVHANGSVSVRRDGGNSALEGDDLVGGPGALTPLDASPPPEPGTPGAPATDAQVGQRVRFTNRVGQQVSGIVTHRSTIGDTTVLQVEQDNGMYHAVNATQATMDGPGASSTTDRQGHPIRVGDQVYVGSGTGKIVSISPDGQYLRVGRSTDGADPFSIRTDSVDSVQHYTPFGTPPQVGEKITVGGEPVIVKEAVPSSARRGDYMITYQRPDGGTGQTRLSNVWLNGPDAPQPVTRDGRPLAVGDQVTWANSGLSLPGTGRVTEIQPSLDGMVSGNGNTHNVIIRGDDGNDRAVANNRLTHWQPTVGTEILHNGERGTVTRVDQANDGGQPIIQYKTADGQIRAANGGSVSPAPPPIPDDISMAPQPESNFRRWGPRAAEIAASGGPSLSAQGLDLNNGAHQEAFAKSLSDMYNGGENGGLGKSHNYKAQVSNVRQYGGQVQYQGSIIGPDGERVGNFTRSVYYKNGKPSEVHNDLMSIVPDHQGQGIARDFYRRQENWAIKNGIPKITVQANINIGGYTWGRLGYDWQSKRSGRTYTQSMLNRLMGPIVRRARKDSYQKDDRVVIGSNAGKITDVSQTSWGRTTYQVKLDNGDSVTAYPQEVLSEDAVKNDQSWKDLQAIQQKMASDPKFVPTPYELGKIGYTPGQTSWPGKQYMLGTSWYGVKRLNPRNSLANATEETQRSATASAFGRQHYGGDPNFHVGPKFPVKWADLEKASPVPPKATVVQPTEELHSTQDRLNEDAVARYQAGTPGPLDHPDVPPRVVQTDDGAKHVLNGHHRIIADRRQGKPTPVLQLPAHVPHDNAGTVSDGDPALAVHEFGWTEGLHPRGKDGKFITKGGFVRLPNGVTGIVKGAKAAGDGKAIITVKTDGPDGKTVSVASDQLKQAPGFGPPGTSAAHTRVIQTQPRVPANDLINAIKANGGFTYDPKTGGLLVPGQDKGIAVAVPGTEHVVGNGTVTREAFRKGVVKVLSQYQPQIRAGAKLGGWYSDDRNAYMVELTEVFPQEDLERAISEGKARNQEGIYDIGNDKFIATGGTGDG